MFSKQSQAGQKNKTRCPVPIFTPVTCLNSSIKINLATDEGNGRNEM